MTNVVACRGRSGGAGEDGSARVDAGKSLCDGTAWKIRLLNQY